MISINANVNTTSATATTTATTAPNTTSSAHHPLRPPTTPSRNTDRGTVVGEVRCAKSVAPAMKEWLAAGPPTSRVDQVAVKDYENTKVGGLVGGWCCHADSSSRSTSGQWVGHRPDPARARPRSLPRHGCRCRVRTGTP